MWTHTGRPPAVHVCGRNWRPPLVNRHTGKGEMRSYFPDFRAMGCSMNVFCFTFHHLHFILRIIIIVITISCVWPNKAIIFKIGIYMHFRARRIHTHTVILTYPIRYEMWINSAEHHASRTQILNSRTLAASINHMVNSVSDQTHHSQLAVLICWRIFWMGDFVSFQADDSIEFITLG